MSFDLVIRGTSQVITNTGAHTEPAERALRPVARRALGVSIGRVQFLGPEAALPTDAIGPGPRPLDDGGGFVGPGFVDAHTHLVFAGERSHEFDLRNQGASYLEIAEAGGGILSTVRATRACSDDA